MLLAINLGKGTEAEEGREAGPPEATRHPGADMTPRHLELPSPAPVRLSELEGVIRKRGSSRAFQRAATIDYGALSTILARSTRGVSADSLPAETTLCNAR